MLHLKRNDSTDQLIRIALRYMQQSTGLSTPFYLKSFQEYGYLLPHSWLKHVFQYFDSRRITVELTDDVTPSQWSQYYRITVITFHNKSDGNIEQDTCVFTSNAFVWNKWYDWATHPTQHIGVCQLSKVKIGMAKPNMPRRTDCTLEKSMSYFPAAPVNTSAWILEGTKQVWEWKMSPCTKNVYHKTFGTYSITEGRCKTHYSKCNDAAETCTIPADLFFKRGKLYMFSHTIGLSPIEAPTIDPYSLFFESHEMPAAFEKKSLNWLKTKNHLWIRCNNTRGSRSVCMRTNGYTK